jgi:hypothetical protein
MNKIGKWANSLFRELKRRRVAKTSVLYVVLCWGALEVADVLMPALEMEGELASRILLYSAIVGFPVVLALAWFFQITPDGVVRTIPFIDRRVLNNIAPINDRRHDSVKTFFRDEEDKLQDHWFLTIKSGSMAGLSYGVAESLLVGRASECDITLPSSQVSRHHARLSVTEEALQIEDLGSANGTLVNGQVLAQAQTLRDGDELLFHDTLFRVSENYAWGDGKVSALSQTTYIRPAEKPDVS